MRDSGPRVRTYSYGRIAGDYLDIFSGPGRIMLAVFILLLLSLLLLLLWKVL